MKTNKARKTDIRVQKTFMKLFEAFFELIKTEPYENISVIRVCEKADIHRATFYKHFVDKQDFVNFCFNKKLDELHLDDDSFFFSDNADFKSAYVNVCKRIINFVYDNRYIIADLNVSNSSGSFNSALTSSISDMLERRLNYVAIAGKATPSPAPILAHYYAGAIVETLRWWSVDGTQYSKEDILRFVMLRINEAEYTFKNAKDFII